MTRKHENYIWENNSSWIGRKIVIRDTTMDKKQQLALLLYIVIAWAVPTYSQDWYYGVFDEFNDPRGNNFIGVREWGMGGVRTALEQLGSSSIYAPAGMAWDLPAFIGAQYDIRTPFPKGTNLGEPESQTLFLPRYIGILFSSKMERFGVAYAVPYGQRVVYRDVTSTFEYTLAEHRIYIPFAYRVGEQWTTGISVGLSVATWKETLDGTDTGNSGTGLGFTSVLHVQWKPQPTMMLGIEAQPPSKVSGDSKFNSVSVSEEWKRPLEVRVGVSKKWNRLLTAMEVFFKQYSGLDNWMVDRGFMTKDQWGVASGVEFPYAGADWRLGGHWESDPVEGSDWINISITAGVGWNLKGTNIHTALVDSHASSEKSLRATRFLFGFEILTPRDNGNS
jgi:hypothetical protein